MSHEKQGGRHRQKWDGFSEDLFLPATSSNAELQSTEVTKSHSTFQKSHGRCLIETSFVDQLVQQQRNGNLILKRMSLPNPLKTLTLVFALQRIHDI
jgi:hypothetical protein